MVSFYFTTVESASGFYIVHTICTHGKEVFTMTATRVFQNGNSQALRIPQEMKTDKKVYCIKELSTNNCCKFMAIFIVFLGFCLKQLQQLFSDNS